MPLIERIEHEDEKIEMDDDELENEFMEEMKNNLIIQNPIEEREMTIHDTNKTVDQSNNNFINQIRRGTIFNHIISDSSNPNLRTIGSKLFNGFHRLSTIKRKSNINLS